MTVLLLFLVAAQGGFTAAFESDAGTITLAAQAETVLETLEATPDQGVSLFQSGHVVTPVMLQDKVFDDRHLGQDDDDVLLEEQIGDDFSDPGECLKPSKAAEAASWSANIDNIYAFADNLHLLQDVVWFVLAFVAFVIWRLLADMDQTAKELAQPKVVAEMTDDAASAPPVCQKATGKNASVGQLNTDKLVKAMYSENKDDLRKFMDERSVNACDDVCCCTALHMAAHLSCIEAAEALLARGADANVCDVWDETPLHFAARAGNIEVCALLLKNKANASASNADGWTPLLVAGKALKAEVCELLLDHGAHAGGADEDELPILLQAILQRRILACISTGTPASQ